MRMRKPERIKEYLSGCRFAETESCTACPFNGWCDYEDDALEYIQKLEEKVELYDECVDDALQLMRERDALMADLTLVCGSESINPCLVCSHYRTDWEKPGCELNGLTCAWSWRGVQKDGKN